MSLLSLGLLVAVAALVIYLLATLIFPERFCWAGSPTRSPAC